MKLRYLIIFLLFTFAAYGGYRFFHREKSIDVAIVRVAPGLVESTVANTRAGTVKARRRAKLAPAIGGQIATLDVRKGDPVNKGQILLSLWNDDIRAQLQLSREETAAAQALARKTCLEADFAERDSKRLSELLKKKSSSASLVDKAATTASAGRAACKGARIQVSVSRARVDTVQAQLDKTILRTPFAGIVAEINGEIGEFITPSPTGVATLPAIDLINLDDLYVTAPIDEMDAARIRPDMRVRISLDAYPERKFDGTVLRIAPYVLEQAKQARTVEVECGFTAADRPDNLLAGYSADVEIILARHDKALRLPAEAFLEDGSVYVVDGKTSRLHRRKVKTGLSNWQFVEIKSGLTPGELVVASAAASSLADGVLVRIRQSPGAAKK